MYDVHREAEGMSDYHYGAPPFEECACPEHRRIRALEAELAALAQHADDYCQCGDPYFLGRPKG